MEDKFLCLIAEIIEMIETKNYSSIFYDGKTFSISDDKRKIDFQVGFGKNSFSVQDNLGGLKYMYAKEFIDRTTSIRQIFMDDGESKDFYSFFKREEDVGIIRVAQIHSGNSLLCTNCGIIGKEKEEIIEYIDRFMEEQETEEEAFEQYKEDNMPSQEEIVERFEEAAESFIKDSGAMENKQFNESGDNNSYRFKGDAGYASIDDLDDYYYDNYYDNDGESLEKEDDVNANDLDDEEDMDEEGFYDYDEYRVILNGKEIKTAEKNGFITKCGIDVSEAYWGVVIMEMSIGNLKTALRYLDNDKDVDLEK